MGDKNQGRAIFILCVICFHFMRDDFHFMRELTLTSTYVSRNCSFASDNESYVRNLPNPVPLAL